MADDLKGLRFADFDELIFKSSDDAARDAAQKLMHEVGFDDMSRSIAPGAVEVETTQIPSDQFDIGFAEGADFLF